MKAFNIIVESPWMIREDSLATIMAVALREVAITEDVRLAILREREARASMMASRGMRKVDGCKQMMQSGSVAMIPVLGPIFRYSDFFTDICESATAEGLFNDLAVAESDPTISAIMMHFDSPGGEAAGIGELSSTIRKLDAKKHVKGYVSNAAQSAAYYLASSCGEVVMAPMAMTGSIGVIRGVAIPNADGRPPKYKFIQSDQSPNKRADPTTSSGEAVHQKEVNALADVFIGDVARYRGVSADEVKADFGRGASLVGQAAVDAGMADRLGSYDEVMADLRANRIVQPQTTRTRKRRKATQTRSQEMAKGRWWSWGEEPPGADEGPPPVAPPVPVAGPDPEKEALRAQVAQLQAAERTRAANEASDAEARIAAAAATWADSVIAGERATSADRPALIARYAYAQASDKALPGGIAWSGPDGKTHQVTAVAALESEFAAKPRNLLLSSHVAGGDKPPGFLTLANHTAPSDGLDSLDAAIEAQGGGGGNGLVKPKASRAG